MVLLYCQHTVKRGEPVAVKAQNNEDYKIRTMMVPCSSKVLTWELLRLLEEGASIVELIACPDGACRFLIGSSRAEKRVVHAQSMLREIGENPERLGITRETGLTAESLIDIALRRFERYRNALEERRNM
jgi:coenzyme F420-reducing hydrogenase delta subunit